MYLNLLSETISKYLEGGNQWVSLKDVILWGINMYQSEGADEKAQMLKWLIH